jgi:hypothetical protein
MHKEEVSLRRKPRKDWAKIRGTSAAALSFHQHQPHDFTPRLASARRGFALQPESGTLRPIRCSAPAFGPTIKTSPRLPSWQAGLFWRNSARLGALTSEGTSRF